jgi:hypothetical protein
LHDPTDTTFKRTNASYPADIHMMDCSPHWPTRRIERPTWASITAQTPTVKLHLAHATLCRELATDRS